jgi:hypothetical protein
MSDQEQQQEHFLSSTPVDVAIKSLQRQVDQLKRIINKSGKWRNRTSNNLDLKHFETCTDEPSVTSNADTEKELKEEIKALKIANEKAEYRIKMLLRTLEEKDKK